MNRTLKRACALLLAVLMTFSLLSAGAFASSEEPVPSGETTGAQDPTIIELYKNPDVRAKGMFRYWIPYAIETREQLEAQMTDMYESGFGGVEIAFFPSDASYDNSRYGWATEGWRQTMKYILEIAASFEDGFIVDFTITPGWPIALNTIDPNDEEADQMLITAQAKLTQSDGVVDVPMRPVGTSDYVRNSFILQDRLVAAVAGRVAAVAEDGSLTLDPDSLTVLDTELSDMTTPAGIPALDRLQEGTEEYGYVTELYSSQEPSTEMFFTDSAGNPAGDREALADVQNYWTADLSRLGLTDYTPSEGDGFAPGDYVLYGFYARGTGGTTLKMGLFGSMEDALPAVPYYTNPLSKAATDAVIGFLEENIFCDEELVTLMQKASASVGGAIFEDSVENHYQMGIPWAGEMADAFESQKGYSMLKYLPIITENAAAADGSGALLHEDYNDVFQQMYSENHIAPLQDYFREKLGYGYRAQAYYTSTGFVELDLSAASAQVDVAEGESLAFNTDYDRFRLVSGGVHIAGKQLVSDEAFAVQEWITYNMPWGRTVNIMNEDFAAGVNRLVFHGASYSNIDSASEGISFINGWPGWHAFDMICTDAWDARMPSWDDIDILSGYIARTQAVLQNGTPRMDVLVFDPAAYSRRGGAGDNSAFTELLDAGYSYDCVQEDGILLPQLTAQDGVLLPDGPAYKAVVVNGVETLSQAVVLQLKAFADAGVPVVFCGCVPAGTNSLTESDDAVRADIDALLALNNVKVALTEAGAVSDLASLGISPRAGYQQEDLRNLMREDGDGSRYWFLYNNSDEPAAVSATFEGAGNAYVLNAWTGDIEPLAECEAVDGGVRTMLHLEPRGTRIIALTENTADFPAALANPIVATTGEAVVADGAAAVKVEQSGIVTAEYADGRTIEQNVTVAEPIELTGWSLRIDSWGPDKTTEAVADTIHTPIELGEIALGSWNDMTAPADQLAAADVSSLSEVVGVAVYETKVTLEKPDGAYLVLDHGDDMITGITVNGQPVADLAPNSDRYDLGSLLAEGENTIQVELSTTLINRIHVEDPMFASNPTGSYGLTGAAIVPYVIVR